MLYSKDTDDFDPSLLYEYDAASKTYILNLAINSFKDMYNTWDYSPHRKRDINEALIKYIEECSAEIPLKHRMSIHLYLPETEKDDDQEAGGAGALRNYFKYLLYKKEQERCRYFKNATWYGFSGFLLLTLAYFFQKSSGHKYYLPILPEGLFIGGWVLFWEVFSIIFFRVREISGKIKEYGRLGKADIVYHFGKTFPTVIRKEKV